MNVEIVITDNFKKEAKKLMITNSKFLLLIFLLCFCQEMFKSKSELYYKKRTDSLNAQRKTVQDSTSFQPKKIKLAKLDTTIFLNMPKSVGGNGKNVIMTSEFAEKGLYKFYKKKGILPDMSYESESCIWIDTIHLINLNKNGYMYAIAEYSIKPCGASSSCFFPTKAILLNNKGKLKIQDIDFIPETYIIDSIKLVNDFVKIYGYDYDCFNHQVIKNFEITLQSK